MRAGHLPAGKPGMQSSRLVLIALFLVLMVFTTPSPIGGDTYWYVAQIRATLGHSWTDASIWDFVHVLWRPLGRLLAQVFLPMTAPRFDGNAQASITFLLMCVSVAGAFVCVLTVQAAVWRLTRRPWIATLAAGAFLCLSPILNYSRSGTPYTAGLACSTLALYLAAFRPPSWRTAAVSGILAGGAALFWAPFLISLPAVLAAAPILGVSEEKRRFDFRLAAITCGTAGIVMASFYGLAIAAAHISSWPGLLAWMRAESSQYARDRTLLPAVTGMARSFYDLGADSVWFKWFMFRDPYAAVGLVDIIRVGLAKLAMFYAAIACLVMVLWRSPMGRRILLVMAIAALPHIGLALSYDSGSPERYLPALPAVAMGFGYAAGSADFSRRLRILMAALFCLHIPANLMAGQAAGREVRDDANRIAMLTAVPPQSRLYVVNIRDGLLTLRYVAPFHPLNRRPLPDISMIVPANRRSPFWRSDFASSVLSLWDNRQEAWISKRVLADRPERSWLWVEGDDPQVSWQAIHRFFAPFEHGDDRGGEDGFFVISNTPGNRSLLRDTASPRDLR